MNFEENSNMGESEFDNGKAVLVEWIRIRKLTIHTQIRYFYILSLTY